MTAVQAGPAAGGELRSHAHCSREAVKRRSRVETGRSYGPVFLVSRWERTGRPEWTRTIDLFRVKRDISPTSNYLQVCTHLLSTCMCVQDRPITGGDYGWKMQANVSKRPSTECSELCLSHKAKLMSAAIKGRTEVRPIIDYVVWWFRA